MMDTSLPHQAGIQLMYRIATGDGDECAAQRIFWIAQMCEAHSQHIREADGRC